MSKTLKESPLTTRNARAALPVGVHWRRLDAETHLGYRKGKRAGVWLVRWRAGSGYRQAPIGAADDALKAGALSFDQAMKAAREHVEAVHAAALVEAAGPPITVAESVESYIRSRDARDTRRAGRDTKSDASSRLRRYVTGKPADGKRPAIDPAPIASISLHELTEAHIGRWRASLPDTLKATTTRRLINDFKAALNAAYAKDRERLPAALPGIVKHGLRTMEREDEAEPVARENQILADLEIAKILEAARDVDAADEWEGDLFRLVLVLAATGCRFSQASRIRVGDFQARVGRLLVPISRKGRGGAKVHAVTVPIGADVALALASVASERPHDAPLLERWRRIQVAPMRWQKERRGAWQSSSELVRPWSSIRDRAGLPDVVPYALRHTSIVRSIRANLPLRLVAAMHDTSTTMIERHYSKWITSGLEEMARGAIVPLVPGTQKEATDHE